MENTSLQVSWKRVCDVRDVSAKENFSFPDPQITDENTFNVTNQITFTSNGVNHEIKYFSSAKGAKATHTLGPQAERSILPNPVIKKAPAPGPVKEIRPNFVNIGKQNLKV